MSNNEIKTSGTKSAGTKSAGSKTMACRDLGGPCDVAHRGADANEVIKAQDRHLREAVADGHVDHEPALKDMKGRWRRPVSGMKWYRQVQRDFADLPVDAVPVDAGDR